MSEEEAKARAREFIRLHTGVDVDADWVRLKADRKKTWCVFYSSRHFYEADIAAGATIEGGEYILNVDDETGDVSVFA